MSILMGPRLVAYRLLTIIAAMVLAATALTASAEAQQPDVPLFVSASVDSERPYVGQQITYIFRIHQRTDATEQKGKVEYKPPSFAGFWNAGLTEQQEFSETTPSGTYRVVELRTPLFPSVAGSITIEPGSLTVSGTGTQATETLVSSPVTIDAQPLPPDSPIGFGGAVGRFDISAQPEIRSEGEAGAVHLEVTVEGEGNLGALPDPNWPDFANWRVIESPEVSESRVVDDKLVGSRTYTLTLLPTNSGDLSIPQITYDYFDPYAESYIQTVTAPITVSIAGGGLPKIVADSDAEPESAAGVSEGARPIKAAPPSLRREGSRLTGGTAYWAAWAVPLVAILAALAWRHRQTTLESARADSQRRNAVLNARRDMEHAISGGEDSRIAAADALLSYLAVRLNARVPRLTREELVERLRRAGVSDDIARRVENTLIAGEDARYSPAPTSSVVGRNYGEHAVHLMDDIEGALSE